MRTYYVGMDVHQASISVAVFDHGGKLVIESVFATSAQAVTTFFNTLHAEVHATLEECPQAAWFYDLIRPLVAELVVCAPRRNKLLLSGNKSDRLDSRKLAHLLRGRLLSPIYHGEHGTRTLKELVRSDEALVRDAARVMSRIKALFIGRGIACRGVSVYTARHREQWLARLEEPGHRLRAAMLYRQLDELTRLRIEARQAMLAEARHHRACSLLKQIPLIGPVRAAQIVATVDTPHRFRTKRQFWAYIGLAVTTRSSADYRVTGSGLRRKGRQVQTRGLNANFNHRLKSTSKSAAMSACRYEPYKQLFERMLEGGMRPEMARLSIARKLSATALAVWKRGENFAAGRVTGIAT
jgi:transposase